MIRMTSTTGARPGFTPLPLLLSADFLQGRTGYRGLCVLVFQEKNSREHVNAENPLMHIGSFHEQKGFMLQCALSV